MDYLRLLYVLERVKAACPDKSGSFRTFEGEQVHEDCKQLETDGLVREVYRDERLSLWELA